jgi:glycosyltransferase involved in cell wall biosynthesis
MRPVVSIIIPSFNRAELIAETLDSVRRQTFADWEAIVVDDGSTDATLEIASRCEAREPRIRVLSRNREPKGAAACRNIGLAAARGDYVIFLDSDDMLAPDCLKQRTRVMSENSGADFAVFQGLIFKTKPGDTDFAWNVVNGETDLCRFLRGDAVWQTAGPIWKKSALQRLGGFDEQLSVWQDVDLHVRALIAKLNYLIRFDLEPDYFYRRHDLPTISQKGSNRRDAVASTLRFCLKAADALGAAADSGQKAGLRFMFARQVQQAIFNRYFDLAHEGIKIAGRHHLLGLRGNFSWRAACACHRLRAREIRGFARLGNYLMDSYQPKISIGLFKISKEVRAGRQA